MYLDIEILVNFSIHIKNYLINFIKIASADVKKNHILAHFFIMYFYFIIFPHF